jgi:hypothetical protein
MMIPDWLPEFVRSAMARAVREQPQLAPWLHEAGGIPLFGTIGAEAFLRPDGSVWYYEAVDWVNDPDKYEWREGIGNDRWAAIVLGCRRIPQLKALLPVRPSDAPTCRRCNGRGEILVSVQADGSKRGITCPDCGRLGWITPVSNRGHS